MKKIKVVQFIYGLNMGGAETLVKEYATRLDKNKYEVIILCLYKIDSQYTQLLHDSGIRIIYACDRIKCWHSKRIIAKCFKRIALPFVVKTILHEERPYVIHSHLHLNRYIKFAKVPKSTKLIYTQHSDSSRWKSEQPNDLKAAEYLMANYNMRIIVLHKEMKSEVESLFHNKYNDRITILNNGIDIEKFSSPINKSEYRKKIGLPANSFVIGHIGRFHPIKNHKFIIETFKKLAEKNKEAFLLLVGTGSSKSEIIEMIQDCNLENKTIILPNRTDINELLKCMDVFVFPSISEGFPISLVEAQIAGIRCFASDTISTEVRISNLVTFLSIKETPETWADLILNSKEQPVVYYSKETCSIDYTMKCLEKIYEEG